MSFSLKQAELLLRLANNYIFSHGYTLLVALQVAHQQPRFLVALQVAFSLLQMPTRHPQKATALLVALQVALL